MKFLTKACFGMLLVTSAMATPAMAQDATDAPSGPITVSGGVDLVSDYRFRGISLSNEKVEVQPTITLSHESGLYAGVWGSGLPKTDEFGKVEVDLYAGWSGEVAPGTSVDIGATYYWYPDGKDAFGPVDYVEIIGKLSHDIGPVSATATVAYAPSQKSLGSDDNIYLNMGLSSGIPNTPVTVDASLGYTSGSLSAGAPGGDYLDWTVGATLTAGIFNLGVHYVDTDIKKTGIKAVDTLYDPTVVFKVGVAF